MNKREKRRRAALIKMRRMSINRRRHKKILPKPKSKKTHISPYGITQLPNKQSDDLTAPKDFRLLSNTKACIQFFKIIRSKKKAVLNKFNKLEIHIDLSSVEHIDFASTMMLDAICEELLHTTPICYLSGTSPRNEKCRQYLIDSGFLNGKYDKYGKPFPNVDNSASIKIERGHTKLEDNDVMRVVEIEKRICRHVTGVEGKSFQHIEMIKEILGNTVDWSEALRNQWIYGAKFEKNKVSVVALDLGKGILDSIRRKFRILLKELIEDNSNIEILEGAFNKKYGSTSNMPNRNKGLPSIKYANEKGDILDLVVIANNVILDFNNSQNSSIFAPNKSQGFNGTLYSWSIDISCYPNLSSR